MGQIRGILYNFQPFKLVIFFFLQPFRYVQIDAFCNLAVRVSDPAGDRIDVDPILSQKAYMSMPECVWRDLLADDSQSVLL